jgi:hypothetical protein
MAETLNTKNQTPEKWQGPNFKVAAPGIWDLGLGASLELGVWFLVFRANC